MTISAVCANETHFPPSRSTGKERDSESGNDYFGKRYYASSMGRWLSPDLVNITEERMMNPANTLNKYAYAADNPLKFVDPDGQDVTYFYNPGWPAGHAVLFAYNQDTGDNSAIESFGPKVRSLAWTGESMFDMGDIKSAQDLRNQYASFTISTTPELADQVIAYMRAHPDPDFWVFTGPDCSSEVWKILQKFKLDRQGGIPLNQGLTPKILWKNLAWRYDHANWNKTPVRGQMYGAATYDVFEVMWQSLPQAPKASVSATATNCVTGNDGNSHCDTQ